MGVLYFVNTNSIGCNMLAALTSEEVRDGSLPLGGGIWQGTGMRVRLEGAEFHFLGREPFVMCFTFSALTALMTNQYAS